MSHFVRCDKCGLENAVLGTVTLPPGWTKVFSCDLCEACSAIVRDFIRFRPGDAKDLPVEPIPQVEATPPTADGKLFETKPEEKAQESSTPTETAETTTEEREKTRKTKKKLMGQDAMLPDKRTTFPHGHNENEKPASPIQPGAGD